MQKACQSPAGAEDGADGGARELERRCCDGSDGGLSPYMLSPSEKEGGGGEMEPSRESWGGPGAWMAQMSAAKAFQGRMPGVLDSTSEQVRDPGTPRVPPFARGRVSSPSPLPHSAGRGTAWPPVAPPPPHCRSGRDRRQGNYPHPWGRERARALAAMPRDEPRPQAAGDGVAWTLARRGCLRADGARV